MAAWLALLVLIVSGFALVGRHDALAIGGVDAADLAMIASGLLLVVWLSVALLPQMRETHPRAVRRIVGGGGILAILALAVVTRGPLADGARTAWHTWGRDLPLPAAISETLALWLPPVRDPINAPVVGIGGEKAVRIRGRSNGQFVASATLNGTPASLLVDSGAAAIVLKASDARGAGVDVSQLSFTTPLVTAHGTTFVAPVRLRRVAVGILVIEDVEAFVAQPGRLETSLLGMSFLSRLRSYDSTGGFLTLRG